MFICGFVVSAIAISEEPDYNEEKDQLEEEQEEETGEVTINQVF